MQDVRCNVTRVALQPPGSQGTHGVLQVRQTRRDACDMMLASSVPLPRGEGARSPSL